MVASAAGSASSRTIADADGGAGLPLRLSKRPSSASFKRIVQHRHRGHQKSSSVPADFTAGTVNRMQVKLDSFKGSSSGRSRGSLSLHAVGRLCHKSHFRGGRRGRQARVVLMPPSHVCPLAGESPRMRTVRISCICYEIEQGTCWSSSTQNRNISHQ